MELFARPQVRCRLTEGKVELRFAPEQAGVDLARVVFRSEVTFDFVDGRLACVNVLDTPELLHNALRGIPALAWDTGWVWIELADRAHPQRRCSERAEIEVLVASSVAMSMALDVGHQVEP